MNGYKLSVGLAFLCTRSDRVTRIRRKELRSTLAQPPEQGSGASCLHMGARLIFLNYLFWSYVDKTVLFPSYRMFICFNENYCCCKLLVIFFLWISYKQFATWLNTVKFIKLFKWLSLYFDWTNLFFNLCTFHINSLLFNWILSNLSDSLNGDNFVLI